MIEYGRLVLDCSGPTSIGFRFKRPGAAMVSVDGQRAIILRNEGQASIDLPAGEHHILVGVGDPDTRRLHWGRARQIVPVWPGHTTTVYYHSPAVTFVRGAIGPVPQRQPGVSLMIAVLALAGFLMVGLPLLLIFR